jgi:hypothetical protein
MRRMPVPAARAAMIAAASGLSTLRAVLGQRRSDWREIHEANREEKIVRRTATRLGGDVSGFESLATSRRRKGWVGN